MKFLTRFLSWKTTIESPSRYLLSSDEGIYFHRLNYYTLSEKFKINNSTMVMFGSFVGHWKMKNLLNITKALITQDLYLLQRYAPTDGLSVQIDGTKVINSKNAPKFRFWHLRMKALDKPFILLLEVKKVENISNVWSNFSWNQAVFGLQTTGGDISGWTLIHFVTCDFLLLMQSSLVLVLLSIIFIKLTILNTRKI